MSWNAVIRYRPLVSLQLKWGQSVMTCHYWACTSLWWPHSLLLRAHNTFLYLVWEFLPKVIIKVNDLWFPTFIYFHLWWSELYHPQSSNTCASPGALRDCWQWLGDAISFGGVFFGTLAHKPLGLNAFRAATLSLTFFFSCWVLMPAYWLSVGLCHSNVMLLMEKLGAWKGFCSPSII